jgi:hypothetical protein
MGMRKIILSVIFLVIVSLAITFGSITGYLNMTYFQQVCRDSDYRIFFKSRSLYEAGSVAITLLGPTPLIIANYSDRCIDDNTLQEYYCGWSYREMTWTEKSSTYHCPKGCEKARCKR